MNIFLKIGVVILAVLQATTTIAAEKTINMHVSEGQLLTLDRDAATVMIADPGVANFQLPAPKKLFLFGKQAGTTNVFVLNINGDTIFSGVISVRESEVRLQRILDTAFPGSGVKVTSTENNVVLSGSVYSPRKAADMVGFVESHLSDPESLINQLKVTMPTQVNIRLRFVEMNKRASSRLGVTWGNLVLEESGSNLLRVSVDPFKWIANDPGFDDFGLLKTGAQIDALAVEGLATVLAEPNLTATTGEPASFLAGGEFPMPISNGLNAYTVEYKQFGILLNIVPTILDDGRIHLEVTPEVSMLDYQTQINIGAVVLPSLRTRRVDTTVELASGQSFVLGGLLQSSDATETSKLPFLGDIPVLGALFRSTSFQRDESELVVIATAYLVEPGRESDYQTPLDHYQPATDLERLLFGKMRGDSDTHVSSHPARALRLRGDNGFYY
ncbi:Type II secretion system protein D [BD1-7 clade bacterium]|uniref:Type II secretion system protein D n=1 Tax=BD1-7 clade bacterium TaxID=2029982 RepID=A0A5S9NA23_9GAMM|nr:Type II secretion system protein D [BD1-7 clade bacterium]